MITKDQLDAWMSNIIREVAELPDRTSPSDQPEMMLVTSAELKEILTVGLQDLALIARY